MAKKRAAPKKPATKKPGAKSVRPGRKPASMRPTRKVKSRGPESVVVEKFVPTFPVSDVVRAANWYKEVLGFTIAFTQQDPTGLVIYGGVTRGPARLHLAQMLPPLRKAAAYLFLKSGIKELADHIYARGGSIISPLKDHFYGMRECTVEDLDGNHIYIGQPI